MAELLLPLEGQSVTLEELARAYEEQCAFVEKHDGRVI